MKKFSFALDKVLSYKEQIESSLRNEHAQTVQAVAKQERLIEELQQKHSCSSTQYDEEKRNGTTVVRLRIFQGYLDELNRQIRKEQETLICLKFKEEQKRKEVIAAKTETSSIDRLKEKKKEEYDKVVQKDEERFVEEFVSNITSVRKW